MAKKRARKSRRARRPRLSATQRAIPTATEQPAQPKRQATAPARRAPAQPTPWAASYASSSQVDFAQEYAYVIADLKRIGLIAASMLGFLFLLSLFIR